MREATNETLNILEQNRALLSAGGLMHCFNGSLETTMRVFDLGFYISLGGAITFKNSRTMPEVLEEIGLSRVTLETDCPYLSPEPFRGKRNEPKNIPIIAKKIADLIMKIEEGYHKNNTVKTFLKELRRWQRKTLLVPNF